jgi:hypothetical protein
MSDSTQFEVLQRLVPELEAEGYEVYVQPNRPLIPAFLGSFSPDVVALRPGKNLVIEVLKPSQGASQKLDQLTALFQNQRDWELRVVWILPSSDTASLQVQDRDAIQTRIMQIKELASTGHAEPAVLLAWATFEALARAVAPERFARPQTPGRILQVLASDGYLTPSEADALRALAQKRNRLIHGELNIHISDQEISNFLAILNEMMLQAEQAKQLHL